MGSMICNRGNCTNIMCTRHNPFLGYICDQCFAELVGSNITEIEAFMKSDPVTDRAYSVELREFYRETFPEV